MNHDRRFSPAERGALDAWTAETPPDDFVARVLARVALEAHRDLPVAQIDASPTSACRGTPSQLVAAGPQGTLRALAAAAAFALVIGCLWSLRGAAPKGADDPGPPPLPQRALRGLLNDNDHDAGPRPEAAEVQPPDDGVQATAS
jgi:hypothetical protein